FVAAQPGIDATRVGFTGISQGGWIIPQAAVRAGKTISWAVIESGPTVTQGESDGYAGFVQSGSSLAEAEKLARGSAFGYDPLPWIQKLSIPVLWLYGGQDRQQPAQHSMEILRGLSGHDFQISYYPDAGHGLFGFAGFPDGLFAVVRDWLGGH